MFRVLRGNLICDKEEQCDQIGYHVYAETLAECLREAPTPVTVGIYGSWGIGKSFITRRVKNILQRFERQSEAEENRDKIQSQCRSQFCEVFLVIAIVTLILTTAIMISLAIKDDQDKIWNTSNNATSVGANKEITTATWVLLILCATVLLISIVSMLTCVDSRQCSKFRRFWKILLYSIFTDIPTLPGVVGEDVIEIVQEAPFTKGKDARKGIHTKYIFVDYNAWKYVGSDVLWAGIVLNLASAIEKEFGLLCVRLFRLLQAPDDDGESSIVLTPTTLNVPAAAEVWKDFCYEFGVVLHFEEKCEGFIVEYDNSADARQAKQAFEKCGITGVTVQSSEIDNDIRKQSSCCVNVSGCEMERSFWKDVRENPKTVCCGAPYFLCCVVFVPLLIVTLVGTVLMMSHSAGKSIKVKTDGDLTILEIVIAFVPPVVIILYIVGRFAWAMFYSQTRRMMDALGGTKGTIGDGLGLMNVIKNEIIIMNKLLKTIHFTLGINYKIIITIDDLDRCPLDMVKSVLEAVSVLLSDRSSPYICLVAANSRVVSKCVESGMDEALIKAKITGHEFMKKIINIPFFIPPVNHLMKQRFCDHQIDEVDGKPIKQYVMTIDRTSPTGRQTPPDEFDGVHGSDEESEPGTSEQFTEIEGKRIIQFEDFEIKCRKILQEDDAILKYLIANPRNIKRIFNVLIVTLRFLKTAKKRLELVRRMKVTLQNEKNGSVTEAKCLPLFSEDVLRFGETEKDARNLVAWIVATDQWPYRMNALLYIIRKKKMTTGRLSVIYRNDVMKEIAKHPLTSNLSSLDFDPDNLEEFLQISELDVKKANALSPMTLNLDLCIQRELSLCTVPLNSGRSMIIYKYQREYHRIQGCTHITSTINSSRGELRLLKSAAHERPTRFFEVLDKATVRHKARINIIPTFIR